MLSKTKARHRWNDPEFLAVVEPLLRVLIRERALLGKHDFAGLIWGEDGEPNIVARQNLQAVELANLSLAYFVFSSSMAEARFRHVDLRRADLRRARLEDAKFLECDFSGAQLRVNADDAEFVDCDFTDAKFLCAKVLHEYGGRRVRFLRCTMTGAYFKSVEFRASTFDACDFEGAKFEKCDLRGARFVNSMPTVENSDLRGAKLDGAPL